MLARDAGRLSASTRLHLGTPGARVLPGRTAYALSVVSDTTRMSRSVPDVATWHMGKPTPPTSSPDLSPSGTRTPSSTRKSATPCGIWSGPTHSGMATLWLGGRSGPAGLSDCVRMRKSAGSTKEGRHLPVSLNRGWPFSTLKGRAICSALRVAACCTNRRSNERREMDVAELPATNGLTITTGMAKPAPGLIFGHIFFQT